MERLLWICLAGAIGTGARYLIALWAAQRLGSAFPHGTLIVNLIGCFAIAGSCAIPPTKALAPRLASHQETQRVAVRPRVREWRRCQNFVVSLMPSVTCERSFERNAPE